MEHKTHETAPEILISTAGSQEEADRLARMLVEHRLAACVQILPGVTSWYRWQGELEKANEFLLIAKISSAVRELAISTLKDHHPYEQPEILVLPIRAGSKGYLDWLFAQLGQPDPHDQVLADAEAQASSLPPRESPAPKPSLHVYLHPCEPLHGAPGKQHVLPAFRMSFDEFLERLNKIPTVYAEPDGSFSMTGKFPAFWRLEGQITDYQGKVAHIELKGWAPSGEFEFLLRLLNVGKDELLVQVPPWGTFANWQDFDREFLSSK